MMIEARSRLAEVLNLHVPLRGAKPRISGLTMLMDQGWPTVFVDGMLESFGTYVVLGLTFSLDEVTRTFFVTGVDDTLPMHIFSMARQRISPEINAVASLLFGTSLLAFLIATRVGRHRVKAG
jgi:hypothetical protein